MGARPIPKMGPWRAQDGRNRASRAISVYRGALRGHIGRTAAGGYILTVAGSSSWTLDTLAEARELFRDLAQAVDAVTATVLNQAALPELR